jgi:ribosomal-protein-alanine N-acetyltransferase
LRPYKEEDHSHVLEIEGSSFQDPWPARFFSHVHRKAPDLFIVAEDNTTIVGYIIGEIREIVFSGLSHMSKMGHILNVAVEEHHRERGIGSMLMSEIEDRFKARGASHVSLEVRESNSTARSFYDGMGYAEVGRVRAYYPDEDAVIMRKSL